MNWAKWLLAWIGGYAACKAVSLLTTTVDGTGIGLYVAFFEINDRLPGEKIPMTAAIFAAVGVISLLAAFALHRATVKGR